MCETLQRAKRQKLDEFYTRIEDIEAELSHYKDHFANKIVFCNCDDPERSDFFKYFYLKFDEFGLKKLITTHYEREKPSYKLEIFKNIHGKLEKKQIPLRQNGDFRSPEAIEALEESEIVCTNPPFSLFREYIRQLHMHNKKFLIIGHQNAVTYRSVFPLIKNNEIWYGFGFPGNVGFFRSKYEDYATSSQHKEGMIRISGVKWFTNLDISKRHEKLILYKHYNPEEYPKYDNYDAINVDKVADIPCDYDGVMGVPITFLDKYNPEQFEILGCSYSYGEPIGYHYKNKSFNVSVSGQNKYKRLFVRNRMVK